MFSFYPQVHFFNTLSLVIINSMGKLKQKQNIIFNSMNKNRFNKNLIFFKSLSKNTRLVHKFHLVDRSYWPFFISTVAFMLTTSCVVFFFFGDLFNLTMSFIFLILISILWWRDVIRESLYEGKHTSQVQFGIKLGVVLFIITEVMFFSSFFWAYFHSSLVPVPQVGCVWPPVGIEPFSPWDVPLLNTYILLLSGATVTLCHYSIINMNFELTIIGFVLTILLAFLFTFLQIVEYCEAPFNISDSVYGSIFFMSTGFHGFHVIIGTIFLLVSFLRFFYGQLSPKHHIGFESAAWYWHFVDVVWLFLFISVYCWGGYTAETETASFLKITNFVSVV